MVVQAYILIQTEVGKSANVASQIGQIKGVTLAEDVTGPYDVVVRIGSENVEDLSATIVPSVQQVTGITRTLTCPIANAD